MEKIYKILIVDDEELICRGIKAMVQRLKFSDVGDIVTANNVTDAIAIATESHPEIIITDIRMPKLNGLFFLKNIADMKYDKVAIALSGYDDFDYVKGAFKYGVEDYLLKPADIDELRNVIVSSIMKLKDRKNKTANEENNLKNHTQMLFETNMNHIFTKRRIPEWKQQDYSSVLTDIFPYDCFHVIGIWLENGTASKPVTDNIFRELEIIKETEKGFDLQVRSVLNDFTNNEILIVNTSPVNAKEFDEELKQILCRVSRNFPPAYISVSCRGQKAGSLHLLYDQVAEAFSYRILHGRPVVVCFDEIKNRETNKSLIEQKATKILLIKGISETYISQMSSVIDEAFSEFALSAQSVETVRLLYERFLSTIMGSSMDRAVEEHVWVRFETFNSLNDIRIYLKEAVYKLVTLGKMADSELTVIEIAKKYINEHLSSEINLAVIANKVSLSYSYLSRLFKEKTGVAFTDYVLMTKMNHAKKLLHDPTLQIQGIAAKIGYENPKNFTRAFKNYFGVSPTHFQDRLFQK